MSIIKKILLTIFTVYVLCGFLAGTVFPTSTIETVCAHRKANPGEGTHWNNNSNYYCVWKGSHISWYADLSSRVWNKDGSAAVLVDGVDNEKSTLISQATYKFYNNGKYRVNLNATEKLSQNDPIALAVYDTLQK